MSKPVAINTNDIISTVNRVVVEEFEAEPDVLVAESRLREDLGLDSLDAVDLVVALELAFGYRIPEQEVKDIRTLGDIYDRIRAHASE